jgi:hypothetical protein
MPQSPSFVITGNSLVLQADGGPIEVPLCLVEAVMQRAEQNALLTSAALEATGLFSSPSEVRLPLNFLLELGAVSQLGVWELQGMHHHVAYGLPTFADAAHELAGRAAKGTGEFQGSGKTPLSARLLKFWIEHFAWQGQALLQAEILVGEVDEDSFVDTLAEFLWTHRGDFSHLLSNDEVTQ